MQETHCVRGGGGVGRQRAGGMLESLDGYTLVTLPRIVKPYRDSVDGTRDRVTYQK